MATIIDTKIVSSFSPYAVQELAGGIWRIIEINSGKVVELDGDPLVYSLENGDSLGEVLRQADKMSRWATR